jgi:hypothetical protein
MLNKYQNNIKEWQQVFNNKMFVWTLIITLGLPNLMSKEIFGINKMTTNDYKKKIELGEYKEPPILAELEKFRLKKDLYDFLGFRISFNCRYPVTPLDVIPFATTTSAGTHFGFLTEFGSVKTLDSAKIIIIEPTNDPRIKIVANNLYEFLSYFPAITDAENLYLENYQKWKEREEDIRDLIDAKHVANLNALIKDFKNEFSYSKIESVEQVYENIEKIRKSYNSQNTIINSSNTEHRIDTFDYNITDATIIDNFLKNTNKESRKYFYSQAPQWYTISKDYDYQIIPVLKKWLLFDGYVREANVLQLL